MSAISKVTPSYVSIRQHTSAYVAYVSSATSKLTQSRARGDSYVSSATSKLAPSHTSHHLTLNLIPRALLKKKEKKRSLLPRLQKSLLPTPLPNPPPLHNHHPLPLPRQLLQSHLLLYLLQCSVLLGLVSSSKRPLNVRLQRFVKAPAVPYADVCCRMLRYADIFWWVGLW